MALGTATAEVMDCKLSMMLWTSRNLFVPREPLFVPLNTKCASDKVPCCAAAVSVAAVITCSFSPEL